MLTCTPTLRPRTASGLLLNGFVHDLQPALAATRGRTTPGTIMGYGLRSTIINQSLRHRGEIQVSGHHDRASARLNGRPAASERLVCCRAWACGKKRSVVFFPHCFVIQPSRLPDDRAPGMQRAHRQALVQLARQGHDAAGLILGLTVIVSSSVHDVLVAALLRTARCACAMRAPALPALLGAARRSASIDEVALAELVYLSVWEPVASMRVIMVMDRFSVLRRFRVDRLPVRGQRRQPLLIRPRHGQKAGVQSHDQHFLRSFGGKDLLWTRRGEQRDRESFSYESQA